MKVAMPASNTDPSFLPAHRLAAEIAARRLSPVDVVEALLANIRALKEQGLTILLAEQGVDFSLTLADRVYILEKGTIRHSGSASELRDDAALRDRLLAL